MGMPRAAGVGLANRLAIGGENVRQHEDFRMARQRERRAWTDFQITARVNCTRCSGRHG